MSCKIHCPIITKGFDGVWERAWEVTIDGRLHPCCYYANDWSERDFNDDKIKQEYQDNPDWNNLLVHTMEEVMSHPLYSEYIHFPGWESDNPPPVCAKECSIIVDDITGTEIPKSTNVQFLADDES